MRRAPDPPHVFTPTRAPASSAQPSARKAFFAEPNLFLLLNVVSDVCGDRGRFDREIEADRRRLFAAMTQTYREHANAHLTIDALNKLALKTMYMNLRATTRPSESEGERGRGAGAIRDLDTSTRTQPPTVLDFPADARADLREAGAGSGGGGAVAAAFETLQAERLSVTPHTPATLATEETTRCNKDVLQRMMAMENARAENVVAASSGRTRGEPLSSSGSTPSAPRHLEAARQQHVADAIHTFASTDSAQNAHAAQAQLERLTEQAEHRRVASDSPYALARADAHTNVETLRENAVPERTSAAEARGAISTAAARAALPPPPGTSHTASSIPDDFVPLASSSASTSSSALVPLVTAVAPAPAPAPAAAPAAATERQQLEALLHTDDLPDRCAFQRVLGESYEDTLLDERTTVYGPDSRERLLIPPRKEFITVTHYLEVSSADRLRVFDTTENPYAFTVYFGSDNTGYSTYPVFDDYPISEPSDTHTYEGCTVNVPVTEVRNALGLMGLPEQQYEAIKNVCAKPTHYMTVYNCPTNTVANVDTLYTNVVGVQTNYVQLYMDSDRLRSLPFVLLEISQLSNVYHSTTNIVRKGFTKLFYDRSTSPVSQSNIHVFIPLNNEKKVFRTPLASIDRLTFKLYTPSGFPLASTCEDANVNNSDVYRVCNLAFVSEDDDDGETHIRMHLTLAQEDTAYPPQMPRVGDCVQFDCGLKWYNPTTWNSWYQSVGCAEFETYHEKLDDYAVELAKQPNPTKECLDALKATLEKSQVRFSYPFVPADLDFLTQFLIRKSGHIVQKIFASNEVVLKLPSTGAFANVKHTHLNTLIQPNILLYAPLYNVSNSTNISLTVWTREEENVVEADNV